MQFRSFSNCTYGSRLETVRQIPNKANRPDIPHQLIFQLPTRIYKNPFKNMEFDTKQMQLSTISKQKNPTKPQESKYPVHVRTDEEKRKYDILMKSKKESQLRKSTLEEQKKFGNFSAQQRAKIATQKALQISQLQFKPVQQQQEIPVPEHTIETENNLKSYEYRPFKNKFNETELKILTHGKSSQITTSRNENLINFASHQQNPTKQQNQDPIPICSLNMFLQKKREKQRDLNQDFDKAISILRSGSQIRCKSASLAKSSYNQRCSSRNQELRKSGEFKISMLNQ